MGQLSVGSLFSGIGGIDLGLERAGMRVVWQCEADEFRRAVLRKRFPGVPCFENVVGLDPPECDLLAGGFPCQDISAAHTNGPRKGLQGEKSGLWYEFARVVAAVRPRFVVVENVSRWRAWVPEVRADLSRLGYASVPVGLQAGSFGAPHRRPRYFVVADSDSDGESLSALHAEASSLPPLPRNSGYWRTPFPGPFRVDDGVPDRVDRLAALGDAVVVPVAEWIGRRILDVV